MKIINFKINKMPEDFHGYEILLLRRLQNDPALFYEWLTKLQSKILDENYDLGVSNIARP